MCRDAAPDLVQIHKKFLPRGVVFLGFTPRSREQASAFISQFGIEWPNAYGVDALRISAPLVVVIGADGHVAWTDERSRYRHDIDELKADLTQAIEQALDQFAEPASPAADLGSRPPNFSLEAAVAASRCPPTGRPPNLAAMSRRTQAKKENAK